MNPFVDRLRNIPLPWVLQATGAVADPHDSHKWQTDQGALSITGPKFMNWNKATGGGGAIDLVMHLRQLPFKSALQWLSEHFPAQAVIPKTPYLPLPSRPPVLLLPQPSPAKLGHVLQYLTQIRGLPKKLLDPLSQSQTLYADARANAVFLLLGKDKNPVGAELRGTSSQQWRGIAPGSRKDQGFFSIPNAPLTTTILCESAIDAISCFALHPHCRCISTAGVRSNPAWLASFLQQGHTLYCGFDADHPGEDNARKMISAHPSIIRLRPSSHDWNDVLTGC